MDIEKLIHCLQCCARVDAHNVGCDDCGLEYCGPECQQLCGTAATALSTLQNENEKLREKIEDARLEGYAKGLGEMSAELKQVKAERDSAVRAIERVRSCKDCGHYTGEWTPPCKECQDSEEHHPYFKWRGQKED